MTRSTKSTSRFDALFKREIRLPIATRLTLSFLIIIIISSLIFTLLGAQIISSLITTESEERVRNDLNTARMIYVDTLSHIQEKTEFTAVRTFLEDILKGNIEQTYVDELRRFKVNEGLDILTITDSNGIVVLRINNPEVFGRRSKPAGVGQSGLENKKTRVPEPSSSLQRNSCSNCNYSRQKG